MDNKRLVFACSCEGTMHLDEGALAKGCGGELRTADQLCRSQLDLFKKALAAGAPITVGCTQEAPLFAEVASEAGPSASLLFANIRENGGWSKDGRAAGPKMAALLAAAAVVVVNDTRPISRRVASALSERTTPCRLARSRTLRRPSMSSST